MNYRELIEKGLAEYKTSNSKEIKNLQQRGKEEIIIAKNMLDIDRGWAYVIAFYAMLRILKALILAEGLLPNVTDEPRNITLIAGSILDKDFKSFLNKLDRMRRRSENFIKDYNKPMTKYESQQALADADEFIIRINDVIKERHSEL